MLQRKKITSPPNEWRKIPLMLKTQCKITENARVLRTLSHV